MNELALFAGAGGGILGGKLLGWRTVCAVERDAYAAQVLAQRQNDGTFEPFPIWSDVSSFDGYPWRGIVDVISGGFPCQDISSAGSGCGLDGARSGLWREMARIIGEVRPPRVLVENSPLLTSRGGDRVIGDLTALGYDCKWGVIGAHNADAPHKRDRIWIVATRQCAEHPIHKAIRKSIRRNRIKRGSIDPRVFLHSQSQRCREARESIGGQTKRDRLAGDELSYSASHGLQNQTNVCKMESIGSNEFFSCESRSNEPMAYSNSEYVSRSRSPGQKRRSKSPNSSSTFSDTKCIGQSEPRKSIESGSEETDRDREASGVIDVCLIREWPTEPELGRVANGVAYRSHRLKAIGNGQVSRMVPLAWSILSK
ncbi:DNA cytosine methyltransferase [Sulfuricurvum sp.]|uniref:DNA cytosine methyltransferase n=1 Tax=Sulfuricurvum sp. TaxID=2025608 RepID=UPI002E377D7A|nr:DNA cytosine methyltransferase [Sulfuricurvum sp.]HEX5328860.1 DNA cytosine methyltransferase [Sulfuricurvum sp.]